MPSHYVDSRDALDRVPVSSAATANVFPCRWRCVAVNARSSSTCATRSTLTQTELSCLVGVSQSTISDWVTGKRRERSFPLLSALAIFENLGASD
ncbi:helix-turn-helix domain-containing protein [Nocardiopsis sp. NPDC006938]|uniref:helix-turn-helix domain-containing protein n=1 Tax=Nocardiopsis sp. NPDC006938 TaxID=3364337 RepID=UPI0036BB0310